jgi:hypothetical protein
MRTIKKTITVETVVRQLYDRTNKQEISQTVEVPQGKEMPPLPDNHYLIEQQIVSTADITYEMKPEIFFKYATKA